MYGMKIVQIKALAVSPYEVEHFSKENIVEPTQQNSAPCCWVGEVSVGYAGSIVSLCVLYVSHNKQ
jgi:hypothetical protein